jgi:hypothetical protein
MYAVNNPFLMIVDHLIIVEKRYKENVLMVVDHRIILTGLHGLFDHLRRSIYNFNYLGYYNSLIFYEDLEFC